VIRTVHAAAIALILLRVHGLHAQELKLPPRSADAQGGRDFSRAIRDLSLKDRENRVLAETRAGNIPAFLRKFAPITVSHGDRHATFFVTPDYFAIGADDDFLLMPLSPLTGQAICDLVDCQLPTTKMVDEIYKSAALKLTPILIPPSPEMTTVRVFAQHNQLVAAQRDIKAPFRLVAGQKKDVVVSNKLEDTSGKVAIYGWHKPDGKAIQPLYTGHSDSWVDYSHGVRLVSRKLLVDGRETTIDAVLADRELAPLLSDEGVVSYTRYRAAKPSQTTDVKSLAAPGEVVDELRLDRGVRVVINRPDKPQSKRILLILYALPNGNTIEQTIGRMLKPGDDWHFDIQHIGAQTRLVRELLKDQCVVVAYLENELRSWPAWRKAHGDVPIPAIVSAVGDRFPGPDTRLVLSGHSGGGSLIFGYLNALSQIPDDVARIAFLDSNYAYETAKHKDKLVAWLHGKSQHQLCVFAYNDAVALLDGKTFVSEQGGTWGRSHQMLKDLETVTPFARQSRGPLDQYAALSGRVQLLLLNNPDKKVWHTVQVELNGFIHSLLLGTDQAEAGYQYLGPRAYSALIAPE
jgi:hypothetical protein